MININDLSISSINRALNKIYKQICCSTSNVVRNIYKFTGNNVSTGTISTVNVLTIEIPANTVSDYIHFENIMFQKIGVGTGSVRLRTGTTNVFASATQIARFTITANILYVQISRTFSIDNNQLIGFPANDSNSTGLGNSTSAIQLTAFDPTVTNYFFISVQLDTITDSIALRGVKITN